MIFKFATLAAIALLGTGASAQDRTPRDNPARTMMLALDAGMQGKELAAAIAEAEKFPLGSRQNPVRENQPEGQRAYLQKLRCADGTAPAFERAGSAGDGPYNFIIDDYKVTCKGKASVDVFINMYHDGGETRPVPGFTIQN